MSETEGIDDSDTVDDVDTINESDVDDATKQDLIEEIQRNKTWVLLPGNNRLYTSFASEVGSKLKDKDVVFFRVNTNDVVEIVKMKMKDASGKEFMYNSFTNINPHRFITLLEKFITPYNKIFNQKTQEYINFKNSISSTLSNITLESEVLRRRLPVIQSILSIPLPMFYEDKLTFPVKGYDSRFNTWLPHDSPEIIKPDMPLEEGKKILEYIFQEFCFKSEKDKTNAIASLITPALRGLYPSRSCRTPFIFWMANRERSGKDYGAGISGIVYEGYPIEDSPIKEDEELRKKITSAFLTGRRRMHFSNNRGHIESAVLESVITNKRYTDRVLGGNKIVQFDNEMEFSGSGNLGITFTPDLANRCRFVNLFLEIENANDRKFNNPMLHEWLSNNRELVLSAIYSLIRNWIDKGKPKGSIPFSSFPEWAEVCGGIMESAGYDNPCKPDMNVSGFGDVETDDMKELFSIFTERTNKQSDKDFGVVDGWYSKQQIRNILQELHIQEETSALHYLELNEKSGQTKFGQIIDRFLGRIFGDVQLICDNINLRPNRRKYKFNKLEVAPQKDVKPKISIEEITQVGNLGNLGNLSNPVSYGKVDRMKEGNKLPRLQRLPKTQSDRKTQFYDADECRDIKPKCSKEDVYNWVKQNPGKTYKELYKKFKIGCLRFKNQLVKDGKIKQTDNILEVVE